MLYVYQISVKLEKENESMRNSHFIYSSKRRKLTESVQISLCFSYCFW